MKTAIKAIISLILLVTAIGGLIMALSEPATETFTIWDILRINGVGTITFGVSVLLLSLINREPEGKEQKGGKYYGVR